MSSCMATTVCSTMPLHPFPYWSPMLVNVHKCVSLLKQCCNPMASLPKLFGHHSTPTVRGQSLFSFSFLSLWLSLDELNLNQCQREESSVNIQVSAQSLPVQIAQGPPSLSLSQHIPPASLKDNNNHVFVSQWLMTHRNFIHGRPVFLGYRDNQVKTKHITGIEFPNLDHRVRGKGKKAEARGERSL